MKILVEAEVEGCRDCPYFFMGSGFAEIWSCEKIRGLVICRGGKDLLAGNFVHPKCPFLEEDRR